jgi:hypothetical protein
MTYVYLGYSDNRIVYIWAGFQALWLLIRTLFHHFADAVHRTGHRMITETQWADVSAPMKIRVLELTLALGKYQTYAHPRGFYYYHEDLLSSEELHECMMRTDYRLLIALSLPDLPSDDKHVDLSITAIIGDTVLASAAWVVQGSKLSGIELYDTCVAFLNIAGTEFAVPSVRVLAGSDGADIRRDIENTRLPQPAPKGATNVGWGISCWYWIPCEENQWLEIYSDKMKILGSQRAKILSVDEVTRRLLLGDLKISLTHVQELKATATLAGHVAQIL